MTKSQMTMVGDHFARLSDHFLSLIADPRNAKAIQELAANELIVRKIKRGG